MAEDKRDYGQAEYPGEGFAIALQILSDIIREQIVKKDFDGAVHNCQILMAGAQMVRGYALDKKGVDTWNEDMILMTALHKVCDINSERDKKRKEEDVKRREQETNSANTAN